MQDRSLYLVWNGIFFRGISEWFHLFGIFRWLELPGLASSGAWCCFDEFDPQISKSTSFRHPLQSLHTAFCLGSTESIWKCSRWLPNRPCNLGVWPCPNMSSSMQEGCLHLWTDKKAISHVRGDIVLVLSETYFRSNLSHRVLLLLFCQVACIQEAIRMKKAPCLNQFGRHNKKIYRNNISHRHRTSGTSCIEFIEFLISTPAPLHLWRDRAWAHSNMCGEHHNVQSLAVRQKIVAEEQHLRNRLFFEIKLKWFMINFSYLYNGLGGIWIHRYIGFNRQLHFGHRWRSGGLPD